MSKAKGADQQKVEGGASTHGKPQSGSQPEHPICFIIMPIADIDGYDLGHFDRVYEFVIKPACKLARFYPKRADDINQTNLIVLDVLRLIVESPMALGDLSARNPNVFYEIGMRQAFNLPITLIKDSQTSRVFDVQAMRDIEYDPALRVDMIGPLVEAIALSLRNTYDARGKTGASNVNSIIDLLGVRKASLPETREVSPDISLVLNSLNQVGSRLGKLRTD